MNYVDSIVFELYKKLTDLQKYEVTEKIVLENRELKEQLRLAEVNRSLPSEKEMTLELINELEKRDWDYKPFYAQGFILGFNTCYSWLKNKPSKNG